VSSRARASPGIASNVWNTSWIGLFWKPIVHWRSNCHPEVLITNITKLLVDILGHIGIAPYCFSLSALKISFASEAQEAENFGCVCRVTTPEPFPAKPGTLTLPASRNRGRLGRLECERAMKSTRPSREQVIAVLRKSRLFSQRIDDCRRVCAELPWCGLSTTQPAQNSLGPAVFMRRGV
jgi:hypothetical protein